MSTFMNYTYQSFNFRNRQGARPFYDLVASIAEEEFAHIELVSTAINTMLTGAAKKKPANEAPSKASRTPATPRSSLPAAPRRWSRTRWASLGTATMSTPPVI